MATTPQQVEDQDTIGVPPVIEREDPNVPPPEPQAQPLENPPVTPEHREPPQPEAPEQPKDVMDIIQPRVEHRQWIIEDRRERFNEKTGEREIITVAKTRYVQRPLSYFAKLEFLKLFGTTMSDLMSGPEGLSIARIIDMMGGGTQVGKALASAALDEQDRDDAETIVTGLTRLAMEAPELMLDAYCIFLAVPLSDRPWFREVITRPADLGGMSDDMGIEILEIFVDQNVDVVRDFFNRLGKLGRRMSKRLSPDSEQAPSKP
jgi:hypothetical protein